ncbi:MAG: SDR family oxidoreductase [Steroidobacteraceae bacterium]
MNLRGKRVLVTGAGGGIGSALVNHLIGQGASVLLTGRDDAALRNVIAGLDVAGERAIHMHADLAQARDRARLCDTARSWQGGIDVLINNAGLGEFGMLADRSTADIERTIAINLAVPMDLCRNLLPFLQLRPEAHIVNIGSAFGSIGFAASSIYCASKFGLRGFSEALRRELADTQVKVHYFAPRATRTAINSAPVDDLNAALGNAVDDPDEVAAQIVALLRKGRVESVLGWPEKFFARVNGLLPRLVDRALRKNLSVIQQHARMNPAPVSQISVQPVPDSNRYRRAG